MTKPIHTDRGSDEKYCSICGIAIVAGSVKDLCAECQLRVDKSAECKKKWNK